MTPAGPPSLNEQYLECLRRYDRGAVRRKRWYVLVWMTITITTWLTLLLAVLGMRPGHQQWLPDWLINAFLSAAGTVITGLTVLQTVLGLQARWLAYRGAAERLRRTCMLYRAGLPPFDVPGADEAFEQALRDISSIAEARKGRPFQGRFEWSYVWDLLKTPPELAAGLPSTPDEGIAPRPLTRDEEVLGGRLRNQRRWYLARSRRYFRRYLLLQAALVGLSAYNVWHVLAYGREYWLVAVIQTVSLGLIACRDFLDWGPLFVRYLQTAGNLKEMEEAFLAGRVPFDQDDGAERRRRLVDQLEQTLSSEFQYWSVTRR
jgi:hypothetical protein